MSSGEFLKKVQGNIQSINNNSRTLQWGSHIDGDTLCLACGHPSCVAFRGKVLYLVLTVHADSGALFQASATGDNIIEQYEYQSMQDALQLVNRRVIHILSKFFSVRCEA